MNLPLPILNFFGWCVAHWRTVLIIAAILVLGLSTALCYRSCKKPAKIDEERVQKINAANEKERKEELRQIIEENADVVRTVDNRDVLVNANIEARDKEIKAKVEDADRKIAEAKSQGRNITSEELECVLIPENCK